ncbi:hypothetical protein D9619_012274 [Psilocybe cf. subviscida]|uniref:F-box domain-containing protein n=1 Tax=Psilocybe cf. subviscida TaxID=2480587 RepID=A0A8H5B7N1_9AGAR|nr:hypothetical protein D9619_012274 [Psilocybe cf. subviscida]
MPAERKSTRLANRQAPKVTVLDDYHSELWSSSDPEVDEDEVVAAKKKGAGAKRKSKASSSTKQPASKKPRGMKGLLKDVVDMPLDILYEIFGHVLPTDLLNLARTSRGLRKILMNRSSASVWRNARANDPHGLPACPSSIGEPAYASLCYAKYCMSCNCATQSPYHIFAARIRLCRKCVDTQCAGLPSELRDKALSKIVNTLPKVEFAGPMYKRYVFHTPAVEKLQIIIQQMAKKHEDPQVRTAELANHKFVKQLRKRYRHGVACAKWLKNRNNGIVAEKASLLDSRRAEVVEYAKGLGWSEELLNFDRTISAIRFSSPITKACSKKITPQALEGIKESLVALLDELKSDHTIWKIETTLMRRLPLLRDIHKDCSKSFHPHTPVISTRDLFHLPAVHELIMGPPLDVAVTEETLAPIRQNFEAYVAEGQEQHRDALVQMINDAYGLQHPVDKNVIFDLATTFFKCKACPYAAIRLPRALVHSCAVRFRCLYSSKPELSLEENTEAAFALKVLAQPRWNEYSHISFDKNMAAIIGDVIKLCGFDPKSTTFNDMELAYPILECLSCNDLHNGRTTMTWSTTANHYYSRHLKSDNTDGSQKSMVLKVVDDAEASYVRSQLNILKEKAYSAQHSERCFCAECHIPGNMPTLKAHWKTVHGRPAGDADILAQIDTAYDFEGFMLWPPRDPDISPLSLTGAMEIALST